MNDHLSSKLEERYEKLSDQELKEILIQRKQYQEEAVNTAVSEAIKRGLIYSEQDLYGADFQQKQAGGSRFFPIPHNQWHVDRLFSSLGKIAYIVGFIPLVYAFLRFADDLYPDMFLFGSFGLIWLILNFWFHKSKKPLPGQIMLAMLTLSLIYVVVSAYSQPLFKIMDGAVIFIVFGIALYSLLYALHMVTRNH